MSLSYESSESGRPLTPVPPSTHIPVQRIGLYVTLGFIVFLLTYVAVTYSKEVKHRELRTRKHNIHAYVEFTRSLIRRSPYKTNDEFEDHIPQGAEEETSDDLSSDEELAANLGKPQTTLAK
jgi:hypothetical protein